MNDKELLESIQVMIERISKEKECDRHLIVLKDFVDFRRHHSTPELESLRDIYYFLCGIMFEKGISDYWNGREAKK